MISQRPLSSQTISASGHRLEAIKFPVSVDECTNVFALYESTNVVVKAENTNVTVPFESTNVVVPFDCTNVGAKCRT